MKLKKNWFYYFSVALAAIGLLYIIVCGFVSLGEGQEYPYLPKGLLIAGLFGTWMTVWLLAAISARLGWEQKLAAGKRWVTAAEVLIVAGVLGLALLVRLLAIRALPMEPASDYKTYYEIAQLLMDGTIQKDGKGYCDYIAMFPHVMGYCYILMSAFKLWGASVAVGQYVNIFFSIATVFIIYKIAKKLGGRIAGMTALVLCAFWPSQVLYITMLSAEYSFTFFFFLCVWILTVLVLDRDGTLDHPGRTVAMHLALGVLIAVTSAIRPMGLILLIAIFLTLIPLRMKMPSLPPNDIPLTVRFLEWGWVRAVMILLPYMILSGVITTNIELTVNRTLPSTSASFGYNLLVGLNTQSKGGWNDEDAALLYSSMEETRSATQAHITCRDLAFTRLSSSPAGMFNLFIEKYELLWGNDDYGATWNIAFLEEQGNLTRERSEFLYNIRDLNNIVYIVTVFFALMAVIYIWRGKASLASLLCMIYLGTAAMHLFVESQNRYHYFVLQIFMILAGMAVQFLFADERKKRRDALTQEKRLAEEKELEERLLQGLQAQKEQVQELRKEALESIFDMQGALESGHVVLTISEAYNREDTVVPSSEETAAPFPEETAASSPEETAAPSPEETADSPMEERVDAADPKRIIAQAPESPVERKAMRAAAETAEKRQAEQGTGERAEGNARKHSHESSLKVRTVKPRTQTAIIPVRRRRNARELEKRIRRKQLKLKFKRLLHPGYTGRKKGNDQHGE